VQISPTRPLPSWPISGRSMPIAASFLYLCTGLHSPHHAPPDWIERYAGHFDKGWDRWGRRYSPASSRPACSRRCGDGPATAWVPAWRTSRRGEAGGSSVMECFAGFLSYTDAQLARVLEFLEAIGDRDDTLIILVSDNGASSEGVRADRQRHRCRTSIRRRGRVAGASTSWADPVPQQLPLGLDHGSNTPSSDGAGSP